MNSFRDIIGIFDGPDQLAATLGVNRWTAHKWKTRDTIPAEYWAQLLATKVAKKHGLTANRLALLADRARTSA